MCVCHVPPACTAACLRVCACCLLLACHPPKPGVTRTCVCVCVRLQAEELLREARVVVECLSRGVAAGMLERLLPKRAKQYAKGVSSRA